MNFIEFNGKYYPEYQAKGNAAQWIMPFAKEWCKGNGLDIGCNRQEWAFPGARMVDITIDDEYHAMNLPKLIYNDIVYDAGVECEFQYDYIFSSHCLEHLNDWIEALEYWGSNIDTNGVLFLYLPHESQEYWHPINNKKHVNSFNENDFEKYFNQSKLWSKRIITGPDLNNSFCIVLIKA